MRDRRLVLGAAGGGVLVVTALVAGLALARRSPSTAQPGTGEGMTVAPAGQAPPSAPASVDPAQGLGCIHGGTTREEVRAIMGEPDSVAFGDWIYGRSSVTFGYGVVLDYSNAGGNLVVCP